MADFPLVPDDVSTIIAVANAIPPSEISSSDESTPVSSSTTSPTLPATEQRPKKRQPSETTAISPDAQTQSPKRLRGLDGTVLTRDATVISASSSSPLRKRSSPEQSQALSNVQTFSPKRSRGLDGTTSATVSEVMTLPPKPWSEMTAKERLYVVMPFYTDEGINQAWEAVYQQAEAAILKPILQHTDYLRQLLSPDINITPIAESSNTYHDRVSDLIKAIQQAALISDFSGYALFCYLGYAAQCHVQAQQLLDAIYQQAQPDAVLTKLHWAVICRQSLANVSADDIAASVAAASLPASMTSFTEQRYRTPLHIAIALGDLQASAWLIAHVPDFLHIRDAHGRTPLYTAVARGHVILLQALLQVCSDDIDTPGGSKQYTPLATAAMDGHLDVVQVLLHAGAHKDAKTQDGKTALHRAAKYGRHEVVRLLLQHGVAKEAVTTIGETPFYLAARYGHHEVVRLLLQHGADKTVRVCNDKCLFRDETPLHVAARYGHHEVVRILLQQGENNRDCDIALYLAARAGHHQVVQVLLDAGVDKEARTNTGDTPLRIAVSLGHHQVVQVLLDAGADTDATNNDLTVLDMAMYFYKVEVVRTLLQYGVSPVFELSSYIYPYPTIGPEEEQAQYQTRLDTYQQNLNAMSECIEEVMKAGLFVDPYKSFPTWLGSSPAVGSSHSLTQLLCLAFIHDPKMDIASLYQTVLPKLPLGYYFDNKGTIRSYIIEAATGDKIALRRLELAVDYYSQVYPCCLEQWLATMFQAGDHARNLAWQIRGHLNAQSTQRLHAQVTTLDSDVVKLTQENEQLKQQLLELKEKVATQDARFEQQEQIVSAQGDALTELRQMFFVSLGPVLKPKRMTALASVLSSSSSGSAGTLVDDGSNDVSVVPLVAPASPKSDKDGALFGGRSSSPLFRSEQRVAVSQSSGTKALTDDRRYFNECEYS